MSRLLMMALLLLSLSATGLTITGCTNTVRGLGEDAEGAGEAMQNYNRD